MVLTWLLELVGRGQSASSKTTTHFKRELRDIERKEIAEACAASLNTLRTYYDPHSVEEPLFLLQKWFDDGSFSQSCELKGFGYLWGDIIAKQISANWVVAQFEGIEYFGLNVPLTSITVAPVSMLEKRQDRGDHIDFRDFLSNTVDAVRKMEHNPEYQRPQGR